MKTFMGYRRPDGKVGVRNYIAILSTVCCANPVAEKVLWHCCTVTAAAADPSAPPTICA